MKKLKFLYILIPILFLVGIGAGAFFYVNNKIYVPTPQNFFTSEKEKNDAKYEEEHGIINVLLIGVDSRGKYEDARTDSMILATLDLNNKKIKLTSFMRDMYVPIPNHGLNRINSAFFLGGPELLIKTINQDFNLNIQYYASVDFKAFQSLVDTLGGIDVEIKDYEVEQINYYIKEANWNNPIYIKGPGYQHLNGQQALSYCRIRKVGNGDYERTERQRKALSLLAEKAKKMGIIKLPELFSALLPYVKTNIPASKIMSFAYSAFKMGNAPIESARIPADGTFENMIVNGMDVLVPDLSKNIKYLDRFIFTSGAGDSSNMPVYMLNNFHLEDEPIDKRGKNKKIIKIEIPKEAIGNKVDEDIDNVDNVQIDNNNPYPSNDNDNSENVPVTP
ncbi:transcriptional attenuator, LytR family [Caloramator quimbayensis]|uniref:Transcriptional attenuator, LytR family n=1 Tax=Caloramator quimbayensis TaxID=1147123 RepID=A0A1T4X845_9CLOT|nr:LCP family protein [Caloramator quimbayensis]SKA85278.1 transcriptional attenuator, LytR family [Caloramator quimbayensis]